MKKNGILITGKNKNLMLLALIPITIGANSLFADNKQLTFSTKIDSVCGIEITDALGSIDFNDTNANDNASFKIKTNSKQGFSKISFTNINKSDNLLNENGKFIINDTIDIDWSNPQVINVNHDDEQLVMAQINKDSTQIISGEARISTTLEIECVGN